jgi:hypothetical protein
MVTRFMKNVTRFLFSKDEGKNSSVSNVKGK